MSADVSPAGTGGNSSEATTDTSGQAGGSPNQPGQGDLRDDAGGQQASTPQGASGSDPAEAQAAKDAAQAEAWLKNTRKVKVAGQEMEVTAEEAFSKYSLPAAAFKKMEEANKIRKEAEAKIAQFEELVRQNPAEYIRRTLGPEQSRRLMEQEVTRHLEWDLKPAHEKERIRFEQERAHFEQQRKQYEQRVQQEQTQQHAQQLRADYQRSFPAALQQNGLEATPELVKEMAIVAQNMLKAGIQWTPEEAARIVAENEREREMRFIARRRAQLAQLPEEQLHERWNKDYGDEILNKFRKADVARVTKGLRPQAAPQPEAAPKKPQQAQKYVDLEALREQLATRRGG